MIVLLIIGIIAMIAGAVIASATKGSGSSGDRIAAKVIGWIGALLILASLVFATFTTVDPGHKGVIVRFGKVTERILNEGLNTRVPFIESVKEVSVQSFKHEAPASAASIDLQDVSTAIALNYHIDGLYVDEVYRTLGHTKIEEYISRFADPAIQETVKKVTANYLAEDLILRREDVKEDIAEALTTWLRERYIVTETVSITDFQFSTVFTASIEAKVAAVQAVLEAENKLMRVRVEAEQREARALGEANARIKEAEGQARAIEIVTAAQVAANENISASLTPETLRYIMLDRFGDDIKLWVVPENSSIVLPSPTQVAEPVVVEVTSPPAPAPAPEPEAEEAPTP